MIDDVLDPIERSVLRALRKSYPRYVKVIEDDRMDALARLDAKGLATAYERGDEFCGIAKVPA